MEREREGGREGSVRGRGEEEGKGTAGEGRGTLFPPAGAEVLRPPGNSVTRAAPGFPAKLPGIACLLAGS